MIVVASCDGAAASGSTRYGRRVVGDILWGEFPYLVFDSLRKWCQRPKLESRSTPSEAHYHTRSAQHGHLGVSQMDLRAIRHRGVAGRIARGAGGRYRLNQFYIYER